MKNSTDTEDFIFAKSWEMYNSDSNEFIGSCPYEKPYKAKIDQNITFVPNFANGNFSTWFLCSFDVS